MTTPNKYEDARLNPEYVDYLEREVRKLEKIRNALYPLEDMDCDGMLDIIEVLR